jgi:ubiquinone/menaquinone biosynthesis C-methylase UbiE
MAIFETLTSAERARQLAKPEGEAGIAVADWLNENNRQINTKVVEALAIAAGHHVLEIGFGNGRGVPIVMVQAPDVRYVGIDISPTMVAEASRFNADLAAAGKASFHLTSADALPFGNASFDRVFSIGVVHFWTEPLESLSEVRRVLRPEGVMFMGCQAPKDAPDFAQKEFGFHLRDASEWDALCHKAGFAEVDVQTVVSDQTTPSGAPVKRYSIWMRARA